MAMMAQDNPGSKVAAGPCQVERSTEGSKASGGDPLNQIVRMAQQAMEIQQSEKARSTKDLKQKDGIIKTLEAMKKELQERLRLSETSESKLTQQKRVLQDAVCTMKEENKELKAEMAKVMDLRKENDSLQKKMAYLASRHDTTTQKLREKEEQLDSMMVEKQALSEILQEKETKIAACMHETQLLQDQIRELHEALQKEAQKMADLEEERMQLQHQLQGVTRFVKFVHELMEPLKPLDIVKAVSDEGNTLDSGTYQKVLLDSIENGKLQTDLTSSGVHEMPQLPADLPDVSMDVLVYFADQMGGKWDFIAYALGVGEMATLLAPSPMLPDSKCLNVLQKWIEVGVEVNWQKLLDVLWRLKLRSCVLAICNKLNEKESD